MAVMATEDPHAVRKTIAVYTGLRLLLFVGAFGVCLVAGLSTPLGIVIALFVSSVLSFLLLREQRERLAGKLLARSNRRAEQKSRRRAALDGDDPV